MPANGVRPDLTRKRGASAAARKISFLLLQLGSPAVTRRPRTRHFFKRNRHKSRLRYTRRAVFRISDPEIQRTGDGKGSKRLLGDEIFILLQPGMGQNLLFQARFFFLDFLVLSCYFILPKAGGIRSPENRAGIRCGEIA